MKTPTQPILDGRTAVVSRQSEIQSLEAMLDSNGAKLKDRIVNADIGSMEALREISTMQTLAGILPVRIDAIRGELDAKERELILAANTFIGTELGPRARRLQSQAREKLRQEWAPHYPNPELLEIALAQSDKLNQFSAVQLAINDRPAEGAMNFAQNALGAWEKLAELEAQV